MNVELYLTIVGSFVTIDVIRNVIRYIETRRMKTKMNSLFSEIEKTIKDIKDDSTVESKPRTRRTPLKPVSN